MFLVGKVLVRHQKEQIVITVGFALWLQPLLSYPGSLSALHVCVSPGRSWARAEMYLRVLVVLEAAAGTGPSPGLHLLINTTTATTLDPLNVTYDPVKILEILKYFKSICL